MKQSYTALLVLAAQGGDKQAFNQLCELHYQASYRFAYKLCQPRRFSALRSGYSSSAPIKTMGIYSLFWIISANRREC